MQKENDLSLHADRNSENFLLKIIFRNIIKRWWLLLIIGFLGGLIGYLYAKGEEPIYESYLSFALDEGGSAGQMSAAAGIASQFGISLGGANEVFTGDNIIEIMLSRRMIESTLLCVDTFNNKPMTLIEFYLSAEEQKKNKTSTIDNVHFYPGELKSTFSYIQDSLLYTTFLEMKRAHISARRPDKKLNIYELMISSHNEKFSKLFTDSLIDKTNHFYTEISSKKARATLEILEKRVPAMKSKLDITINNKAAIEDANLNTAFANAQVPLLKEQSNTQVYGAAYAEMFKNLEMARFQYLKSIPLMQVIDLANYPMKKIETSKLITTIVFSVVSIFIFSLIFAIMNIFKYKS
ncbi:MAG: Wzz/FepE/Etk N-terminal domain-containing protein [Ginsengibacter sp.]